VLGAIKRTTASPHMYTHCITTVLLISMNQCMISRHFSLCNLDRSCTQFVYTNVKCWVR